MDTNLPSIQHPYAAPAKERPSAGFLLPGDAPSLPRAGTDCVKHLSCLKCIPASLTAVRRNPQNQPEKSCFRSNFSERLSRLIIRLGGECVRFRLILRISSYCWLAQRPAYQTGQVLSTARPGSRQASPPSSAPETKARELNPSL